MDPRVTGQVTFLSHAPMPPEAFYEAFLAMLAVHGFVAFKAGEVIKILPDANARVHPATAEGEGGDRIATRVLALENVGAAQLVPLLRPLVPQYAHLTADPGTNSLIINAPARVLQDMNAVIDKLDIRRAQVQVDAIIVELTESRANELGVTWALQGAYENHPVAGTNFPSSATGVFQLGPAAASGDASVAGALPEGIVSAVGRIGDAGTSWAAVLTALAGDASTNIIATPTIVTLDNEQAQIEVGSEVPFLTGQYSGSGATVGAINPFQTIDRTPVGTRLMITPQINEGSGVKLIIEQETSSISQGVQGAVDLVTDRRSIRTSVFVEDGSILVLGGLIDDQLREVEQRVPLLGRVPGVGALFRSRSTELKKTNLMVFIRPTILRDSAQATFQTDAKYRYIRDLQLEQGEARVPLMSDEDRPTLPALEDAE